MFRRFFQLSVVACCSLFTQVAGAGGLPWLPWSPQAFAAAKRDKKFVLMDLEAVWCHWCHVMDETTYADPAVAAYLQAHFVLIRVDEDSRPDIANRYEDYGWPATAFFAADGSEIVKKQGYIPPGGMLTLLREIVADPSPVNQSTVTGSSPPAGSTGISPVRRDLLRGKWLKGYDPDKGGWGFAHKFLDADTVEYALRQAAAGDRVAAQMAVTTLTLERQLLDPVWGGVYQYSVDGDWKEPHYEKIVSMQADDLRLYALAFAQTQDPADLEAAQAIHRYLKAFLCSPDGAFYVSQDADLSAATLGDAYYHLDDAGRRALGIPRVDRHLYARENGWCILALVDLAEASGDYSCRRDAETAAQWILAHRALPDGGFRHDEKDVAGPFLGDTLAMGRAFLALYDLSGDPIWLVHATAAARFIRTHFGWESAPGFASADTRLGTFPVPVPQFDENVNVVRFMTALAKATGRAEYLDLAKSARRWLETPGVTDRRGFYVGGFLLAEEEVATEPVHIAILSPRNDPIGRALHEVALKLPTQFKLVEWFDPKAGSSPSGDTTYPQLDRPAAFVCANGTCSSPIFTPDALAAKVRSLAP